MPLSKKSQIQLFITGVKTPAHIPPKYLKFKIKILSRLETNQCASRDWSGTPTQGCPLPSPGPGRCGPAERPGSPEPTIHSAEGAPGGKPALTRVARCS